MWDECWCVCDPGDMLSVCFDRSSGWRRRYSCVKVECAFQRRLGMPGK